MMLLLLACTATKESGESSTLLVEGDGTQLELLSNGRLELRGPRGSQQWVVKIGKVREYDEKWNYDPYLLKDPAWEDSRPSGLTWQAVTGVQGEGEDWSLILEDGDAVPVVLSAKPGGFGVELALSAEVPFVSVSTEVDDTQRFYGLGETFDAVEKRGTLHAMHIVLETSLESSYNEAHVPVPLLLSTGGWGLRVASWLPGVFDVAATDPGIVETIFEQQGTFAFDLYAGSATELVEAYHRDAGLPEVPPTWAFAPLQWRNVAADQSVILEDAAAIRANGVATGLIWVDNPWQSSYNSMQPEASQFPDWPDMVEQLHDQGFRFMAWTTPYVEEEDPEYQRYQDNGWFVDAPILFSTFGPLVDYTHPDATAAWTARVQAAKDIGIEGWKLDYGEDLQIGIGTSRTSFGFYSDENERTLHHRWAELFHTPYAAPYNGEGFLLGRGGAMGTQTVTDCIWPGDLDSDFRYFREDGHVGGLPSAIRGGISLAASGFPFFASDTGGYRHDRPTHEVMIRWTEFSALLPIMQYGGGGANHNPWDFTVYDASAFTEETLALFKRYATLHTRLFPLFWELAQASGTAGTPGILPVGLAYPDESFSSDTAFMIGSTLLVQPVEQAGVTTMDVELPAGDWVHWWSGQRYAGGTVNVPAPVGEGPLFQRAGTAVPMLRRSIQTLSPSDGSVDSWADDPGILSVRVVQDGTALEAMSLESGEQVAAAGGGLEL
ncbi:MAG TPA: glycoside hydrolase family 31 protein, partial [Myxococcota bacterium]|nr:glycoside hydrolase family 31 protein [Myxococcota bacterium]